MTDIDVPMERIRALAHRAATEAVAIDRERDLTTMRMREIMADLSETTTEMHHAMDGHYPKTLVCSMSKELAEAVERAARNASLKQNAWIERACLARLDGDVHRRTGAMQPRVFPAPTRVRVKLSSAVRQRVIDAATADGISVSLWIRSACAAAL